MSADLKSARKRIAELNARVAHLVGVIESQPCAYARREHWPIVSLRCPKEKCDCWKAAAREDE